MIGQHRFWNFVLSRMAKAHGFLDPAVLFANLQKFSKPSEVWVPTELLRSGVILQARGLLNSQAIQHNRDWIWPYWVQRQFDPTDISFIPRAFNVSHINLTHRNWTAIGLPDSECMPLVDPRGLVTPHYDGWSLDAWLLREKGDPVIPSFLKTAVQTLSFNGTLAIDTRCGTESAGLVSHASVLAEEGAPVCRLKYEAWAESGAWLAVVLRPYNPEGVAFIHKISPLPGGGGWLVNGREEVHLPVPAYEVFSNYSQGDVFSGVFTAPRDAKQVECKVGMATAAALYRIEPKMRSEVNVRVPLATPKKKCVPTGDWKQSLAGTAKLEVPDEKFRFLYDTALRMLILHSPGYEVYPGPYTYKRFWFRDAAFILDAMLTSGMVSRVEKVLDRFPARQMPGGHFLSQDGEWDSNGQALWIMDRFCRFTAAKPKPAWRGAIVRGARWIKRKRGRKTPPSSYAGLLPAGFSAEHLGPNDFYYWDDFWAIGGLRAASSLMMQYGDSRVSTEFSLEAQDLSGSVEKSLAEVKARLGHPAVPASPSRRMDAGAIGSLTAGYPLQLWAAKDDRLTATAGYLVDRCFLNGGFYQEISHSGLNAYLTLHVAQVLLRAGLPGAFEITKTVAKMATSTGQWPEAVHPQTGGGCMGDGQHIWAAAEWVLMMRNMFVREEGLDTLVLCSGIPKQWLKKGQTLSFGPALTAFGTVNVTIECGEKPHVSWDARWNGSVPKVEVRLPEA